MINNGMFIRLLECINNDREAFDLLVKADNTLGLDMTTEDIINYLEFTNVNSLLSKELTSHIIITEGDILSVLKIVHDIVSYRGDYILFINEDNAGTITYLVNKSNDIYGEYNLDVKINIDYSANYNRYVDSSVDIIGSEIFVKTASKDFNNPNLIIV